jgi:hypothetical protein
MLRLRYILFLSALVLLVQTGALAQDYVESALIYSRFRPGGSARVQALGGAQVGLGGDYSSAASNPAGLGKFNRSEFSITPSIGSFSSKGTFLNQDASLDNTQKQSNTKFQLPGLSLVFNVPSNREGGAYVGGSFALTLSRTNDFNHTTRYTQPNYDGSIIDYFVDNAQGYTTDAFLENGPLYNDLTGLSYHNYLIGPESILGSGGSDTVYFTDVKTKPDVREDIKTKGGTSQWNFAYGANFKDRFYLGVGVGLTSLHYKSQKTYTETFPYDTLLTSLQAVENLDIKGNGVNATFGVLARPWDFVQIGLSYTTPTFTRISESYDASLATDWQNYDYNGDGSVILDKEKAETDIIESDYNITLPSRLSAGVAFITKYGFLTGDVEMSNPGGARYSAGTLDADLTGNNDFIKAAYKRTLNYRFGAEGRYSIFRLRAGYGIIARAYKGHTNDFNGATTVTGGGKITTISGGVGVKLKTFYIDFALVRSSGDDVDYLPYTFRNGSGPVVRVKNVSVNGLLTVGFTW